MDGVVEFTSKSSHQNTYDAADWCGKFPNVRIVSIGATTGLTGEQTLYVAYRIADNRLEDPPPEANESGALAVE